MQNYPYTSMKKQVSPAVIVLSAILVIYAMLAGVLAGFHLYRVYARPAMYYDVYELCEALDTEYLAKNAALLCDAGYMMVEGDGTYEAYVPADWEERSGMCIYAYPDDEPYEPYFRYQKDYTATLIPFSDGYSFYYDGRVYLEMITYAGDDVSLIYDELLALVEAVEAARSFD